MTTMTMTTRIERRISARSGSGVRPGRSRSRRNRPSPNQRDETRPALRLPVDAVVDRQRAEVVGLRGRPGVAGGLDRIVVERRDLGLVHAVGREPGRNMDVAEPLDVGEHLVGAGSGDRAGGLEGVADQHDTGLAMARADIEIGRPDLDVAGNRELAGEPAKPRQRGVQRRGRRAAHFAAARDRRTGDRRTGWPASCSRSETG